MQILRATPATQLIPISIFIDDPFGQVLYYIGVPKVLSYGALYHAYWSANILRSSGGAHMPFSLALQAQ